MESPRAALRIQESCHASQATGLSANSRAARGCFRPVGRPMVADKGRLELFPSPIRTLAQRVNPVGGDADEARRQLQRGRYRKQPPQMIVNRIRAGVVAQTGLQTLDPSLAHSGGGEFGLAATYRKEHWERVHRVGPVARGAGGRGEGRELV